jgi:hypothetical protein
MNTLHNSNDRDGFDEIARLIAGADDEKGSPDRGVETISGQGATQAEVGRQKERTHQTTFDLFGDGHQSRHGKEVATQPDPTTFQAISTAHDEHMRHRRNRKSR